MYKASELERASMALDEPMNGLEHRIMTDIVRRIRENGEITAAADWQITRLVQLGVAMEEISAAINEALGAAEDVTSTLFENVLKEGYVRDKSLYEAIGKVQIPFEENAPLQQLISSVTAQTNETMQNITQSLGFAQRGADGRISFTPIADYYQKTLDNAMFDISSGAFDYNTVLNRTVKEMTNSGLRTVDYATGWSNRVPVAARRAVMTGMTQLTAQVNEQNAEELETDWFEISWHGGARPSHWWGGKWYTKEQLTTVCNLGDVTGLCGANCYHDYSPVIPGISEPTYTEEELAELNRQEKEPIEYCGKKYTKYEALQRQRRLETTMRAQRQEMKLLKEGGADEDDLINCRARYRGTSHEYATFSQAMGLPQQRERVTADGLGNIMQGKYTGGSGKESPISVPPVGAKVTNKVTAEERKELLSRNKVDISDNAKTTKAAENPVELRYKYVEAQTIEEAQAYAEQFRQDDFMAKNFKGVDYKGISVENANAINRALTDVYNKVDLDKISGIKVVAPNSAIGKKAFKDGADAVFSYDPIQHGIYINKDVLKNEKTFAEYLKRSDDSWNTVMDNIDKMSGSQKELALTYKNAGRSLVDGQTVEGLFTHELGHHVQWTLLDADTNNAVGRRMSEYAPKISGYANASKGEYLAESFTAYMKGERDILDPEYVEFIDSKTIDKSTKSGIIGEKEELPRKMKSGSNTVDWSIVQSEEYSKKFTKLSDDEKVSSAIETRAKWALNNRDGKNTEELYAISLKDGREAGRIIDQNYDSAVKRTPKFTRELNTADESGEEILLLHNHPRGLPPSISDINALLKNKNVSGITVGHNGSIYRYTRPNKEIPLDEWNIAMKHFKEFSETTAMEKSLEILSRKFEFIFEKI